MALVAPLLPENVVVRRVEPEAGGAAAGAGGGGAGGGAAGLWEVSFKDCIYSVAGAEVPQVTLDAGFWSSQLRINGDLATSFPHRRIARTLRGPLTRACAECGRSGPLLPWYLLVLAGVALVAVSAPRTSRLVAVTTTTVAAARG